MIFDKLAKLFKGRKEETQCVPSKTPEEIEKEKFLRAEKEYELKVITLLCEGSPVQVRVALSMPYRDWCELQNSESWKGVLEFHQQKQNEGNRNNCTKGQLTVEMEHL